MKKGMKASRKIMAVVLFLSMFMQQAGFAQIAGQVNLAGYLGNSINTVKTDKFQPLHLRYFSYNSSQSKFKLIVDKGSQPDVKNEVLSAEAKTLFNYFLTGINLSNQTFWVNLRPDSSDQIIDPQLGRTDVGKILLEADLQLKKDTAAFTSPDSAQGKVYWNKLYKKAAELFGSENITILTLTRPWIVPGEVIISYSRNSAYIYKANLKVMLEQDYLANGKSPIANGVDYSFKDPRQKALNEYSSQLIRELIIPQLTKEVNTAKRYAGLRQVFYSLVLAQWFKARYSLNQSSAYAKMIDSGNLSGLTSQKSWDKTAYFKQYQKSFAEGEYNIKESVSTPSGQVIRSYFSGGVELGGTTVTAVADAGLGGQALADRVGIVADEQGVELVDPGQPVSPADDDTGRGYGGEPNYTFSPDISNALTSDQRVHPYSAFSVELLSEADLQAVEENMLLVQAGKDYQDGGALVGRAASLTNWMWTDLLRDRDVIGLALHKRKLALAGRYNQAIKDRNWVVVAETLEEYSAIRDQLCMRWLSLAIDAHNGVAGLPGYANDYAEKMFNSPLKEYDVIRDLYFGRNGQPEHGDNLRNISIYTLDPIGPLVAKAKAQGIALFALGAGGPGTVIAAVSRHGIAHLKSFLEEEGIPNLQGRDDHIYEVMRTVDGRVRTLRGYVPFKVGREPIRFDGFNQLVERSYELEALGIEDIRLPEDPLDAAYNQQTGEIRVLNTGEQVAVPWIRGKWFKPQHNWEQGKPYDPAWIRSRIRLDQTEVRRLLQFVRDNGINLEIVAHLRGVDGCGSSLDLPEFQLDLTEEGAKLVIDLPSTTTIASDFEVKITFEAAEAGFEDAVVYEAPDYFAGQTVLRDVELVPHADAQKAAAGMMMLRNGQKDAPAYIFKNLFGLTGIKITCQKVSPLALAGGMESSNAFNVALIAAASMLSGADLNKADIFNLAVKLENDEFNGLTGGQGHLSSMLGGAFQNIWLSGIRNPNAQRQFAAFRMQGGTFAQHDFLFERPLPSGQIYSQTIPVTQQILFSSPYAEWLQAIIQAMGLTEQMEGMDLVLVNFKDGRTAHYSLGRNHIFLDISLLNTIPGSSFNLSSGSRANVIQGQYSNLNDAELAIGRRIKHELTERNDVIRGLEVRGLLDKLSETVLTPENRTQIQVRVEASEGIAAFEGTLAQLIDLLAKESHDRQQGEDDDAPVPLGPSSPAVPGSGAPAAAGGIDFRFINIMAMPKFDTLKAGIKMPDLTHLKKVDINKERTALEKMMQSGVNPSSQRVMEYLAACYAQQKTQDGNRCLINYLRLQEESVNPVSPEFLAFLLLKSGKL